MAADDDSARGLTGQGDDDAGLGPGVVPHVANICRGVTKLIQNGLDLAVKPLGALDSPVAHKVAIVEAREALEVGLDVVLAELGRGLGGVAPVRQGLGVGQSGPHFDGVGHGVGGIRPLGNVKEVNAALFSENEVLVNIHLG